MSKFLPLFAGLFAANFSHMQEASGKDGIPSEYKPRADAKREEIPKEFKWKLEDIYKSPDQWEEEKSAIEKRFDDIIICKGHLFDSPKSLADCLDLVMDLRRRIDDLQVYANADFSTNQQSPVAKARADRVQSLSTKFAEITAFIEPEIIRSPLEKIQEFSQKDDRLKKYQYFFDDLIRRRKHVLSEAEERILALTGDLRSAPYFMRNALESEIKFPKVKDENGEEKALSPASFPMFRVSPKREVRMEAVEKFFSTLKSFSRSYAQALDMAVKANIFNAKARGYASALEASLDQNAIPTDVYFNLIDAVSKNLGDTLHRYVKFRTKKLGVDKLRYYDLYNPIFESSEKVIHYKDAAKLVRDALKIMGDEYDKILSQGIAIGSGWVDVYPHEGKRGGAYCNSAYRYHPIVLLNYMERISDVFTLAHEFGHALHFYFSHKSQEYVNANAPIFLAEIASTFNEEILLEHLLSITKDNRERLSLLNRRIENIRTTVFRQVMFAEFELEIYKEVEKGGALTAERMSEIYRNLIEKYYGPWFEIGEFDPYEWAYIPHFYYNFYVYQYATGLMSAIAFAKTVLKGEGVERYIGFLKAGGSDYPIKILKQAGIDLTNPATMQATFDLFKQTLDEIEKQSD